MSSETAKRMLGESVTDKDQVLQVIEASRPQTYHVCPHCKTEIFEKHVFSDDRGVTMRHSDCGGAIEYPETPLENIASWLRPYVEQARKDKAAGKPLW